MAKLRAKLTSTGFVHQGLPSLQVSELQLPPARASLRVLQRLVDALRLEDEVRPAWKHEQRRTLLSGRGYLSPVRTRMLDLCP